MKSKNGFTLIELLAIIVILAIIGVITIPIILNVIENSKKGAAKDSAYGYVDSVNKLYASKSMGDPDYEIPDGYYAVSELKTMGVSVSGNEPIGRSWVSVIDNEVVKGCLQFDEYKAFITDGVVGDVFKGECDRFGLTYIEPTENDTHMGIVYMDVKQIQNPCNERIDSLNKDNNSIVENADCMKFYIYDDNGDGTVDMIVDHNVGSDAPWFKTEQENTDLPNAQEKLENDTEGWIGDPRFIGADEVAHIVGADSNDTIKWARNSVYNSVSPVVGQNNSFFYFDGSGNTYSGWQTQIADSTTKSNYSWLYDYTYDCVNYGCSVSNDTRQGGYGSITQIYGYWTSDCVSNSTCGNTGISWVVKYNGMLGTDPSPYAMYGVRPVITVSKLLLGIE